MRNQRQSSTLQPYESTVHIGCHLSHSGQLGFPLKSCTYMYTQAAAEATTDEATQTEPTKEMTGIHCIVDVSRY